jgi:TRAP-type C4-dicarboxylate transport system permease small subunit
VLAAARRHESRHGRAWVTLDVRPQTKHTFNQTKIMKKQLIRISILQSSKIMTALYVLMGFIYTLIGLPMIIFGGDKLRIMGIVYLAMPVIMGIFGFIFFVIFAAVYNGLAKLLGGFEVEIKDIDHAA